VACVEAGGGEEGRWRYHLGGDQEGGHDNAPPVGWEEVELVEDHDSLNESQAQNDNGILEINTVDNLCDIAVQHLNIWVSG